MYIVASSWKFGGAATAREAVKRMRAGLAPLIGAQPGLHAWYLTITGADEVLTISVWTTQDNYEQAQPNLAAWVQEQFSDLDARVQQRRRGHVAAQAGA